MNIVPWILILLLVIALGWMSWRYISLRRAVDDYAGAIFRAARGDLPTLNLPSDIQNIEFLSNTIASLQAEFDHQLSSLTHENARLAAILNQMTDGVLIADAGGRIQFANPAARKLFETGDPVGRGVVEVIRHHQLVETWRKCQQGQVMQSGTVEIPAKRQIIQLIAIPDQYAGGALLLAQDLTTLRRIETVRRDFISNVSHELRTPLASLKALTETLQSGALEDPPAARRFLERIEAEVDALTQMASELLDLTRIESGQTTLNLANVLPQRILDSVADRMKMQAERASLDLLVQVAAALPPVRADMARIEQVLVNLIHNAIKFTPPGGRITLSAALHPDGVCFSVGDTGSGIPPEELPRIFERFYRVDRARTKGSGTGLGLSIAKHIIEAHGGKIWAESQEGAGSMFYFTLPGGASLQ
jgi:two-component system phosphate regulon sensor histidine kinase PhoR